MPPKLTYHGLDTFDVMGADSQEIYTNGIYGSFGTIHKADPNPRILIESVDLSQPEHIGILWRMKYMIRMYRLVKVVYNETNDDIWKTLDGKDSRPTVTVCLASFEELDKSYTSRTAKIALAMATKKGYLSIDSSKSKSNQQRLVVTGDGLILLTPTGFINALAGSIGKVALIGSWIVSVIALLVSIYAAAH